MPNTGHTDYECLKCDKNFGNRKSNYNKHLLTKKHLKQAESFTPTNEIIETKERKERKVKPTKDQKIEELSNMLMTLQNQMEQMKNTPQLAIMGEIQKRGKYKLSEILNRDDVELENPHYSWKLFLEEGYYYDGEIEHEISSMYPALAYAANLLIAHFKDTKKRELPILVLNRKRGAARKIAYYTKKDGEFIVKTDIEKKKNVELYVYLNMYLSRSIGQMWLKKKLKSIYKELPIEIRDKMYYQNSENKKISFLDFYCDCEDGDHHDCYKAKTYYDERTGTQFYKYKNVELMKPDGTTFSLKDDAFTEFTQEFYDYLDGHEYSDVYHEYRKTQLQMAFIFSNEESDLNKVCNETFDKIMDICSITPLLNLKK